MNISNDDGICRQVIDERKMLQQAQECLAALSVAVTELDVRIRQALDAEGNAPMLAELQAVRALLAAQASPETQQRPATAADVERLQASIAQIGLDPRERAFEQWKREQCDAQMRAKSDDGR